MIMALIGVLGERFSSRRYTKEEDNRIFYNSDSSASEACNFPLQVQLVFLFPIQSHKYLHISTSSPIALSVPQRKVSIILLSLPPYISRLLLHLAPAKATSVRQLRLQQLKRARSKATIPLFVVIVTARVLDCDLVEATVGVLVLEAHYGEYSTSERLSAQGWIC